MESDPNSPTVVFRAPTSVVAAAVITALEAEGIQAEMTGSFTSSFQAEAPGLVEVVVRRSEADRACAILERLRSEAESQPWPEEDDPSSTE